MKNKLYYSYSSWDGPEAIEGIISAPSIKEARKHSLLYRTNQFFQLRINVLKNGCSFIQHEPEIHFSINCNGFLKTDLPTGRISWDTFIRELEKRNLLRINFKNVKDQLKIYKLTVPNNLEKLSYQEIDKLLFEKLYFNYY